MSKSVVPIRSPGTPAAQDHRALALIRRTVATDCNDDEFNLFIHTAHHLGLDPLRRQIYAFVYNKDKKDKRKMSIITGIDGFRTIAERTGNYRPDEEEPTIEIDESLKGPLNPVGIVKATVRVFKFSHGSWHKVTASAYWEEYAPIKAEWAENEQGKYKPTGKQSLDTSGQWGRMPRLMLAKVAEALALRKAWPDAFSDVYASEEMDQARAREDLLPAEAAAAGATEERLERIGGGQTILVDWMDNKPLEPVAIGRFADRVFAFIKANKEEPSAVAFWADRNKHALREFWARAPGDALAVKAAVEKAVAEIVEDSTDENA
jgi:phage recombination protein Bet